MAKAINPASYLLPVVCLLKKGGHPLFIGSGVPTALQLMKTQTLQHAIY